jgi:hypothetical protein
VLFLPVLRWIADAAAQACFVGSTVWSLRGAIGCATQTTALQRRSCDEDEINSGLRADRNGACRAGARLITGETIYVDGGLHIVS